MVYTQECNKCDINLIKVFVEHTLYRYQIIPYGVQWFLVPGSSCIEDAFGDTISHVILYHIISYHIIYHIIYHKKRKARYLI